MSEPIQPVTLWGPSQREHAKRLIDAVPAGHTVRIKAPTRSDLQNKRLWPHLEDIARQVEWHGFWLTAEEWKDVFTAALKRQKVVPGLEGGFVVVGGRTSTMTVGEFADLLTLIQQFGDERGVVWSDPREVAA